MGNSDLRLKVHQPEQLIGQSSYHNNAPSQLSFNTDYFYNGGGNLWVIARDGLCYCLDGSQGHRRQGDVPGLTVYCSTRLASFVQVDMHRELQTVDCFSNGRFNDIKTKRVEFNNLASYYSNFISDFDILEKGGSIYVPALDVVLCTVDPVFNQIRHPFSPGVELTTETLSKHLSAGAGTVKIRIIDNDGVTATKWYRVGDIPIAVAPIQNADLASGVYLIYRGASEVDEIRKKFTLAELENDKTPVKFYNSKAEALAADELAKTKLETEQTKLETEQLKAKQQKQKPLDDEQNQLRQQLTEAQEQLRKMQQQQQEENARTVEALRDQHARAMETERKRFASETDLFKAELETLRKERENRTKDRYDDLSYERKNFNEMLKMIPTIVSIVLSIVVLVKAKK